MTNAKNKKSVIAIIAMAFLLVASIVLAATGAWFTSTATDRTGNADVKFGKVAISIGEGDVTLTKSHVAELTVDNCSWAVTGLELTTTSSVDMYYQYEVKVEITGADTSYFTVTGDKAATIKKWTVGGELDKLDNISIKFDSNNAMNGSTTTATIKVTVSAKAIQADHLTAAQYKTFFDVEEAPADLA